jgi:hypothetical protein
MQNGVKKLARYLSKYRNVVIKLRKLENRLRSIDDFGWIFNSYSAWKYSVHNNIDYYEILKEKIVSLFDNQTEKEKMLYKQCSVNNEKLIRFMEIRKTVDIYYSFDNMPATKIKVQEIMDLLPRCNTVEYNSLTMMSVETIEKNHKIDISDRVMYNEENYN